MLDFQKLLIWQKSHALTLDVYKITKSFPKEEIFGLVSQMRRSASSIPTNIAEGSGRQTTADFKRFLVIGIGSVSELEYQFILSKDIGYISQEQFDSLSSKVIELRKMIFAYSQKL
ncbi:MAG: four helix bundle protein [Bacteroidota bacterium]|nr:four helix bundle protein [Bacteroidota bacterium]